MFSDVCLFLSWLITATKQWVALWAYFHQNMSGFTLALLIKTKWALGALSVENLFVSVSVRGISTPEEHEPHAGLRCGPQLLEPSLFWGRKTKFDRWTGAGGKRASPARHITSSQKRAAALHYYGNHINTLAARISLFWYKAGNDLVWWETTLDL